MKLFILLVVIFLFVISTKCQRTSSYIRRRPPRVTVENGIVAGKWETSYLGEPYQAFLGIPYAKPPVDDNRFKEPQRLDGRWYGEYNASVAGSRCLQLDHYTRQSNPDGGWSYKVVGDEDCLFMNVYTRDTGVVNKEVIVYIHGGAFMFCAGDVFSPKYLLDSADVVFVTFNYRLGPLGFLTTGDSYLPGNNGLKDQVAALEWIQRNIAGFDGDPKKVTITGMSAGGASVHLHYLSTLSNGLFNRGISFSGTALNPWVLVKDGPEKTLKLAELLGCPTMDSRSLVKCLRRRPAYQIVERVRNFQSWLYNPFTVFGPVIEIDSPRPFIDQHPADIITTGLVKDLPWITTVTTHEGLYPAAEFIENETLLKELNERWIELAPDLLFYDPIEPQTKLSQGSETIRNEYFGNKPISVDTANELIQLLGDRLFVVPGVSTALLQSQHTLQQVYFYEFGYRGVASIGEFLDTKTNYGVSHGDDLSYVFGMGDLDTHTTADDKAVADFLTDIVLHFAATGKTADTLKWEPLSKNASDEFRYLRISSASDFGMEINSDLGRKSLWEQLFPEEAVIVKDEL